MNPKFSIPLVCLLLLAGLTPLNGQGLIFQKDITVERNEIEDNVISLGGTIWVKGEVKQSVIAIGGKIIIEGKVGDTVFGFGTDIELTSSAVVDGDVATIGGQLDKHLEAVVRGDTVTLSFDTPEFLKDIFAGGWGGLITIILIAKLISLVFWFIFAVILAAAFPRQTSLASSQIRNNFWPTFGIGLLCIIIFTGAVIFSAFLALVLIGIPIIITLATVGIAVKIFGRVIIFHFFGQSLARSFNKKNPAVIAAVILGFLVVSVVSFIPIIGSLFSMVVNILGWGAVIRTKFGTRENWFRKGAAVMTEATD
jgi:hypothetical protein